MPVIFDGVEVLSGFANFINIYRIYFAYPLAASCLIQLAYRELMSANF
jgi:hypothetical protein